MATLPFAQAITDMTAGVFALLSNVTVVIGGQPPATAMFQAPGIQANMGGYEIQAAKPMLILPTAEVPTALGDWLANCDDPASALLLEVDVNGTVYKIVTHDPNGAGISHLLLELA